MIRERERERRGRAPREMRISILILGMCVCVCYLRYVCMYVCKYRREWESYEIRTLCVTARLLYIDAPTLLVYVYRAIVCALIQVCARRANANMCKRRRRIAFTNNAGICIDAIFNRSLYIRNTDTVRLHLFAYPNRFCFFFFFRKRNTWFWKMLLCIGSI